MAAKHTGESYVYPSFLLPNSAYTRVLDCLKQFLGHEMLYFAPSASFNLLSANSSQDYKIGGGLLLR